MRAQLAFASDVVVIRQLPVSVGPKDTREDRGQSPQIGQLCKKRSIDYLRHCECSSWIVVRLEPGFDVDVEAWEKWLSGA